MSSNEMILTFTIENQTIERTDDYTVVADSQNYLKAQFTFSDDWDGLFKTAVFIDEDGTVHPSFCDGDIAEVPTSWIKAQKGGVGVIGSDGTTKITTKTAKVKIKGTGYEQDEVEEGLGSYFDRIITELAKTEEVTKQNVELSSQYSELSEAFAHGKHDKYPEQDEDNAKYYSEKAKEVYEQTNEVYEQAKEITVGFDDSLQGLVDAGKAEIVQTSDNAKSEIETLSQTEQGKISDLLQSGKDDINDLVDNGKSDINNLVSTGNKDINDLVASGKSDIQQASNTGVESVSSATTAGVQTVSSTATTEKENINTLSTEYQKSISDLSEEEQSIIKALSESEQQKISELSVNEQTDISKLSTESQTELNTIKELTTEYVTSEKEEITQIKNQTVTAKNTAVENATIASNNAEKTTSDLQSAETLKGEVEQIKTDAEQVKQDVLEAEQRVITLMSTDTRSYFFETLADRDAYDGFRNCDRCSVYETKCDYIYDTQDIDADGVNPEWIKTSEWDSLKEIAWSMITGKPTFADVAFSGDFADLKNTPSLSTSTPIVLTVEDGVAKWDYSSSNTAVLTTTEEVTLDIENASNGNTATLDVYGTKLKVGDNWYLPVTYGYLDAVAGEHFHYEFQKQATGWLVSMMVVEGGNAYVE
jgi:hypothetical protein